MAAETATHLICAIGTSDYYPADYVLDERTVSVRYGPAAIARLCVPAVGRVTVLATPQAEAKHWAPLRDELAAAGVRAELARVNAGADRSELLASLEQLIGLAGEGERIALDVTHALRHLPFTYFAAITYLSSFRGISLIGIYYAAWEQQSRGENDQAVVPILDITTLYELTEWYHAVRSAGESGDLRPLQRAIEKAVRAERRATHRSPTLQKLSSALNDLAPALAAGLPIEAGLAARRALDALPNADPAHDAPELAPLSLRPFTDHLERWAVAGGVRTKAELPLDDAELRRQLRLIRWYVECDNIQEALLLMREWMISRAMLAAGTPDWLGYEKRKPYEAAINAAAQRARFSGGSEIGRLWDTITDARNFLAHADTELDKTLPSSDKVRGWVDRCEALLTSPIDLAPPGSHRVLLTPLGLTAGVVFTAAALVRPEQIIVVTSKEAEPSAHEALAAAGMADMPRLVRALADPFAGVAEAERLAETLRQKLAEARELIVNVTGGTTAMQLVVERLAQVAARLGIPVRRIFLIDRRSADDQRREPFVLGELVDLGGANDLRESDG